MPYYLQRVRRHAHGAFLIADPSGLEEERDTVMCAHCQMHYVPEPGSGHKRGWCFKCQAPLCGKRRCLATCEPWERAIERMEARVMLDRALEL